MYTKEEKKAIVQAWNAFIKHGVVEKGSVREVILESWVRSSEYGVKYINTEKPILSQEEINIKLAENDTLISVSKPYLENIYKNIDAAGFFVTLTDAEGYILLQIGDEKVIVKSWSTIKTGVGANRSEKTCGTNAMGVSLVENKPVQICGEEHYIIDHRKWACSAAPIHDLNNNIIGCLNLTVSIEDAHLDTLGIVVAAVEGIENQIIMQKTYNDVYSENNLLKRALESISEGVIVIDIEGKIKVINKLALDLIDVEHINAIERSVIDFIDIQQYIDQVLASRKEIINEEIGLSRRGNIVLCKMQITIVEDSYRSVRRIVINLKEMKEARKSNNRMIELHPQYTFESIIGSSENFKESINLAKIAAEVSSNVLLLGESGTGKELFAQAIHNESSYKDGQFIAINCGALPKSLIESELFGYEGGAFTGSRKEGQAGKFEIADKGTILLDEIGDMPLEVQVSLLRVLEDKEIVRVGGKKIKKIDVRIIASTNKDLQEAVLNKTFRNDLYYRLNAFSILIPPLRERGAEDIRNYADYFLMKSNSKVNKNIKGINEDVYKAFLNYNWPGNLREFGNFVERAVNIAKGDFLQLCDFPLQLTQSKIERSDLENSDRNAPKLISIEAETIKKALKQQRGNIKMTAELLGIPRRSLYRKMEIYSIDYDEYRA